MLLCARVKQLGGSSYIKGTHSILINILKMSLGSHTPLDCLLLHQIQLRQTTRACEKELIVQFQEIAHIPCPDEGQLTPLPPLHLHQLGFPGLEYRMVVITGVTVNEGGDAACRAGRRYRSREIERVTQAGQDRFRTTYSSFTHHTPGSRRSGSTLERHPSGPDTVVTPPSPANKHPCWSRH